MGNFDPDRNELRKFGITAGMVFLVFSAIVLFRQKQAGIDRNLVISCLFFIATLLSPGLLKPVYILLLRFARAAAWIHTRIILCIIFYLIFAPAGLAMRLFKVDLLERNKSNGTYWKHKEMVGPGPLRYERRF